MNNWLILEQTHSLSQNQIQSLELLTMDSISLSEFLYNEHLENPVLEREVSSQHSVDSLKVYKEIADTTVTYNGSQGEENSFEFPGRSEESLRGFILSQLREEDPASKDLELTDYLIQLLDENGYMDVSVETIAWMTDRDPLVVTLILDNLRTLEPAGIFSANLQECLIYLLKDQGLLNEKLEQMVRNHLDDIAQGRIKNITKALGISTVKVREYISYIRALNPRPLSGRFGGEDAMYIVPDIVLSRESGQWNVSLNDNWVEDYHISDFYLRMMEETEDEELKAYFRGKIERARNILRNIRHRRETIIAITQAVVELQKDFFDGTGELKPMTMQDIADAVDIHISTVSRGIRDKYLQYPKETVLFKKLFSQPASRKAGENSGITADMVQKRIRQIVENEDPTEPLSDQRIMVLLEKEDILISRRTVAKYREIMHIPGAFRRKR